MKSLVSFINEMHKKDYDAEKYENPETHKKYKDMAEKYVKYCGKENFKACIDKAIIETNKVLRIFLQNGITGFVNGQLIGHIIETKLVESLNFEGFTFKQGREISDNKDITCIKVSKDFLELGNPAAYGIEVKCSQGTGITGNKSYALDVTTDSKDKIKPNKDSFYLLINYTSNIKIPQTIDDQNAETIIVNNNVESFGIKLKSCYFGYIEQNDWMYGDTGNSASLKMPALKKHRLIEIC